ncbi:MAG: GFA family protein [Pseudomonadota bacterium]
MSQPDLPWEGGCRCGQVRFKVSAPPILTMACHCTGCQKMTSSAFSLSAAVPSAGFEVTAGEPVIGGLHGAEVHHYFCPHCMSWMFTRAEGMDWFVNVRTPMLDGGVDLPPFLETFTSEKLPWATTPAEHSFAEFPPMETYQALTKAYLER